MSHGIYQLNPDVNHLSQLSVVTMPAMSNRVGGVMQGAGVSIDTTGVLSVAPATSNVVGGVKQGANVTIAADGTISVASPTATNLSVNGKLVAVVTTTLTVNGIAVPSP